MPDRVRRFMAQAVAQTHRAGDVIRRLRELTRKGGPRRSLDNLDTIVEETCGFATLGVAIEGIDVETDLASGPPPVLIDSVQVQQVVLNLVRNSLDALRGREGAAITVATARRGSGELKVALSDTGPGVAPEVRERLFDPFVSTKPDGIGIGLGICRTTVEVPGGEISVEPGAGNGATFRFTLPAFAESGDHDAG